MFYVLNEFNTRLFLRIYCISISYGKMRFLKVYCFTLAMIFCSDELCVFEGVVSKSLRCLADFGKNSLASLNDASHCFILGMLCFLCRITSAMLKASFDLSFSRVISRMYGHYGFSSVRKSSRSCPSANKSGRCANKGTFKYVCACAMKMRYPSKRSLV